jgi:DegV family protein with EDD domain
MTIRVVTDSTCDLPAETIRELKVEVIPLYINVGSRGYLDGIDMTRREFYEQLPDFDPHPTTAAPGVNVYHRAYERAVAQGAAQILSIHISSSLSATVDVARVAAEAFKTVPVTVLDAQQLSLGTGFQVETAASAAAEGLSMPDILALLDEQIARTHVFAALDTLEYLQRSGRMNAAVAGLGKLLRVKPLLRMHAGNPTAERVRTQERATRRVIQILEEISPLERVALVHTNAPERAQELRLKAEHLLPDGDLTSADITPVIGANIGPGAVGFACISANLP